MTDLNPHGKQMADESMVRNLEAQARAIWPQEIPLLERYGLADTISILDAGCGTGEASRRLAELYPRAQVLGIDIIDAHLELARERAAHIGPRLRFEHKDLFALDIPDDSFDLTVNRHVIHSIPHADRVLAELARVTRPGGRLHLISEDYGMLHFQKGDPSRGELDPADFWHTGPVEFGAATGVDLHIGRSTPGILADLGLAEITMDYIVVDTLRVPPETFAAIIEAWRDGYADPIGEHTHMSADEARAYFDRMIANIRDPRGYAVWMVPVVSARVV